MVVSAQYAAEHFDELEAAVDRGEKVEIARDARASLHLVPSQTVASASQPSRGGIAGLMGDWADRPFLPENWDSPENDKELWMPFWEKVDPAEGRADKGKR